MNWKDCNYHKIIYFTKLFYDLLSLFTKPFQSDYFDFSDKEFFGQIAEMGENFAVAILELSKAIKRARTLALFPFVASEPI